MYGSLKSWLNVPLTIKPFSSMTGTGDKAFGDPIETSCYPNCEVKVVKDWDGVEVVSNTQLYIEGKQDIGKFDELLFENEEYVIKAISTFYRNGVPDIKVVYV